jgi:hypothetical protein
MEEQRVGRALPNSGDLLVSRRSARADAYQISVVSESVRNVAGSYREAVDTVGDLAGVLALMRGSHATTGISRGSCDIVVRSSRVNCVTLDLAPQRDRADVKSVRSVATIALETSCVNAPRPDTPDIRA